MNIGYRWLWLELTKVTKHLWKWCDFKHILKVSKDFLQPLQIQNSIHSTIFINITLAFYLKLKYFFYWDVIFCNQMYLCFSNIMMWHVFIKMCKRKDFTPSLYRILFHFQYYLVLSCNLRNSQRKSCNLVTLGTANYSHWLLWHTATVHCCCCITDLGCCVINKTPSSCKPFYFLGWTYH